ncbi:MAG: hypothetical protein HKN72_02625 [Gemmatimonadetes bacterium]|nr:hypothetical protein [Gemmatimonadota bacterium]
MRTILRRMCAAIGLSSVVGACALALPPERPSPTVLGCFAMESDVPSSFADTLGYELPEFFSLSVTSSGQWLFLPTDEEWAPTWSHHGRMPSDAARRRHFIRAGQDDPETLGHIPGDSIDIVFPGPIGSVVVRLGGEGEVAGGRAAYALPNQPEADLLLGSRVSVSRASCERVPLGLQRTRYAN